MPLQQTTGNVTTDAYGGGVAAIPNYIEDVFSTWLYTGNNSAQTITNGIDLAGKGGLVWGKSRSASQNHRLYDTARGSNYSLISNDTAAQSNQGTNACAFNADGFSLSAASGIVGGAGFGGPDYVSWTFRKQPKFFDVVTYTGNGASTQVISHLLGSAAGCVIVKPTNTTGDWFVYHASIATGIGSSTGLKLNTTGYGEFQRIGNVTSTTFEVQSAINVSGDTYVAYLFAHNAGGFGLTGTDNVISCGSFTTDSSGNFTTTLGYEPQWILFKNSGASSNWNLIDTMRGWPVGAGSSYLRPNTSGAETTDLTPYMIPTATGFAGINNGWGNTQTYIYIAIRRGPMKVPTSGTSVFAPSAVSSDTTPITTNFPVDSFWEAVRAGNGLNTQVAARLIGQNTLTTSSTAAEAAYAGSTWSQSNTSYTPNIFGSSAICYAFGRAPSFFDEVCYTGTGNNNTSITHNLAVVPELIIVKDRSAVIDWGVYHQAIGQAYAIYLNQSSAAAYVGDFWGTTAFTSTTFRVGNYSALNTNTEKYVAYLFATCAGVSKVGSYTGNGTTQTINCGFTGGARFVLIKRTDSTGDWYVYDTARGMTVLTDPYLLLNSSAAESATLGSVTTVSTGFAVNASILAAINTNGASYIFLAIA